MVTHPRQPVSIASVTELVDQFDLFLFDQYGVLHNGIEAYPGRQEDLSALKAAGKAVAVISNSGKRADVNARRLATMGFDNMLIDAVYTSGEVTWQYLHEQYRESSGQQHVVFLIGNDSDRSAIEGLPLCQTDSIEQASFVLIAGRGTEGFSLADYKSLFTDPVGRGVPALCSNPDLLSIEQGSKLVPGPGEIAAMYQALGGECRFIGKPHADIYSYIKRDTGIQPQQVLCIGDSIQHDITGARNAGFTSLLVRTGIHRGLDDARLEEMYSQFATPDYVLDE